MNNVQITPTVVTTSFDISVDSEKRVVKRDFSFSNGDVISFSVTIKKDPTQTISDLNRESVEVVVAHLQRMTGQK